MSSKTVDLPDIGLVLLTKRRGNRNLRMSFDRSGTLRVSLPMWVPYYAAIKFAEERKVWIERNRPAAKQLLYHLDRIGKAHQLVFTPKHTSSRPSVRVHQGKITVSCPAELPHTSKHVQATAERGALKALKLEADRLLPQRLRQLAVDHDFRYNSVTTKRLASRWGSCSQNADITLNIFLMQLPWELIDYVLVHELVHTEHLDHSGNFWRRFEHAIPDAKKRRKLLKQHKTAVIASI